MNQGTVTLSSRESGEFAERVKQMVVLIRASAALSVERQLKGDWRIRWTEVSVLWRYIVLRHSHKFDTDVRCGTLSLGTRALVKRRQGLILTYIFCCVVALRLELRAMMSNSQLSLLRRRAVSLGCSLSHIPLRQGIYYIRLTSIEGRCWLIQKKSITWYRYLPQTSGLLHKYWHSYGFKLRVWG